MNSQSNNNIHWQQQSVLRALRENANQHKSAAIWLTGLSGAGKSTIAQLLEKQLFQLDCKTYVLDGDNVRHGLCKDLTFTDRDRNENIRRVGEVAKLFVDAGVIVISAFISPFRQNRDDVRSLFDAGDFIEVYCNADILACEKRDVKGLYAKARQGLVRDFTGISSPYEYPINPELVLDTAEQTADQCVTQILEYLFDKNIVTKA
jgi:adenylylsulfate kinase